MRLEFLAEVLDAFLEKNAAIAEVKRTPGYVRFRACLRDAITKQAKDIADRLSEFDGRRIPLEVDRALVPLRKILEPAEVYPVLVDGFTRGVKRQYRIWALRKSESFSLSNPYYISELRSQASYLINRSSLDTTTRDEIISIIQEGKLDGLTNAEVSDEIVSQFEDIADWRATMITRTEVARAMSFGDLAAMRENGVPTKSWIIAGDGLDSTCRDNAGDGEIPVDQYFSSGDDAPPGHPNCECYLEAGRINLDDPSLILWDGS